MQFTPVHSLSHENLSNEQILTGEYAVNSEKL